MVILSQGLLANQWLAKFVHLLIAVHHSETCQYEVYILELARTFNHHFGDLQLLIELTLTRLGLEQT